MREVTDGKYSGELLPEEVIEQFQYRAGIHASYIQLLEEQPNTGWGAYGTKEWHEWAINGYEEAIRHLRDYLARNTIYRCSLGEAISTIIRAIFRR